MYTVTMHCSNCLTSRTVSIPKGQPVGTRVCPTCGVAAMRVQGPAPVPPMVLPKHDPLPTLPPTKWQWDDPWHGLPPWRRPGRPRFMCMA